MAGGDIRAPLYWVQSDLWSRISTLHFTESLTTPVTSSLGEVEISQSHLTTTLPLFLISLIDAGKQIRANGRDSCSETGTLILVSAIIEDVINMAYMTHIVIYVRFVRYTVSSIRLSVHWCFAQPGLCDDISHVIPAPI